jgi:hypothetical protein
MLFYTVDVALRQMSHLREAIQLKHSVSRLQLQSDCRMEELKGNNIADLSWKIALDRCVDITVQDGCHVERQNLTSAFCKICVYVYKKQGHIELRGTYRADFLSH